MGITADDYKKVVNRNLYLEDTISQLRLANSMEQQLRKEVLNVNDQLVADRDEYLTNLQHTAEDLEIRNAQYRQLLDFYHNIRELSTATNTETAEWTLYWQRKQYNGTLGKFEWNEDDQALPITFRADEDVAK